MSTDVTGTTPAAPDGPAVVTGTRDSRGPASVPNGSAWRLSRRGISTVAVLELRQRVRSTRWIIVLVIWGLVLAGLTTLIRFAVGATVNPPGPQPVGAMAPDDAAVQAAATSDAVGQMMFGIIVFLVLGLAGLIAPALTATSVNGDRQAGVLATLQTTLLSPAEIAVGKLLAAWTTALALLGVALPFILWAYLEGGTPFGRLLVILLLLALMLLVVCAVALGWSAVTARTSSSAVLTYLSVAVLGLGLPLLFVASVPLVQQNETVTVIEAQPANPNADGSSDMNTTYRCVTARRETARLHTERTWWLLAANPFVVLADAAPRPARKDVSGSDPLTEIRTGVREARLGPPEIEDWCGGMDMLTPESSELKKAEEKRLADREALGIVWPYGLAADLLLGGAFLALTVRRLQAPARTLPRGTRVA